MNYRNEPSQSRQQQVFTVTRLNSAVRMILEQDLGLVWLTGELSNLAMPSSGHWYFSLKDMSAQVRCAMFKGNNRRVAFRRRMACRCWCRRGSRSMSRAATTN